MKLARIVCNSLVLLVIFSVFVAVDAHPRHTHKRYHHYHSHRHAHTRRHGSHAHITYVRHHSRHRVHAHSHLRTNTASTITMIVKAICAAVGNQKNTQSAIMKNVTLILQADPESNGKYFYLPTDDKGNIKLSKQIIAHSKSLKVHIFSLNGKNSQLLLNKQCYSAKTSIIKNGEIELKGTECPECPIISDNA